MLNSRIDKFIQHLGVSYNEFERSINAGRGSVSGAIKNDRNLGSHIVESILRKHTELSADWLFRNKGEMLISTDEVLKEEVVQYRLRTDNNGGLQQIPLYNLEATAGLVELFRHVDEKTPIDFLSIPNLPKCDGAVFVTGDSMYPLLKSGDIVIYKEVINIEEGIFWGEMYLVSVDLDGEEYISVKYIQKSDIDDNHIKLVSQNGHHQSKDIRKDRIRAIAMVKASVRINAMR
ncbi:Phage repressor protein C [Maribacter dokdonensis]|uniref:S24 family peptidase n=1 Tax=Maribacter dokdonensis TaxID=320912 RepID=UPI001B164FEA|nr:helix-turn-helix transcriptional regulator [Maribacter dokdonensis]CAG2532968.1 Phage repressor protein C [Maribacter dokdonensis]